LWQGGGGFDDATDFSIDVNDDDVLLDVPSAVFAAPLPVTLGMVDVIEEHRSSQNVENVLKEFTNRTMEPTVTQQALAIQGFAGRLDESVRFICAILAKMRNGERFHNRHRQ